MRKLLLAGMFAFLTCSCLRADNVGVPVGLTPAGQSGDVQYSNGLSLSAEHVFTYDPSGNILSIQYVNGSSATFSGGVTGSTFFGDASHMTGIPLPPGSTSYIQNRATLQSGSTFYVSSGTVNNLTSTNATLPQFLSTTTAASTYLTQSSATSNYLSLSSATATYQPTGSYLTTSSATSTYQPIGSYLTISSASATYQPKGSYISGSTNQFILNQNALQSGSTFYVSIGKVDDKLTTNKLTISTTNTEGFYNVNQMFLPYINNIYMGTAFDDEYAAASVDGYTHYRKIGINQQSNSNTASVILGIDGDNEDGDRNGYLKACAGANCLNISTVSALCYSGNCLSVSGSGFNASSGTVTNLQTQTLKFGNGTTMTTAASGMAIGSPVPGGNASNLLFVDGSGNLGQDNNLSYWGGKLNVNDASGSWGYLASNMLALQDNSGDPTKPYIIMASPNYQNPSVISLSGTIYNPSMDFGPYGTQNLHARVSDVTISTDLVVTGTLTAGILSPNTLNVYKSGQVYNEQFNFLMDTPSVSTGTLGMGFFTKDSYYGNQPFGAIGMQNVRNVGIVGPSILADMSFYANGDFTSGERLLRLSPATYAYLAHDRDRAYLGSGSFNNTELDFLSSGSTATITYNPGTYSGINISTGITAITGVFTNSGANSGIKINQTGTTTDSPTVGALAINNTGNNGIGLAVYSNQGATQVDPLINVNVANTNFGTYVMELNVAATNYYATTIEMQAPIPSIEFRGNVAPTAPINEFQISEKGDELRIDGRQADNNGFGSIMVMSRPTSGTPGGGLVYIGNNYVDPKNSLDVGGDTSGSSVGVSSGNVAIGRSYAGVNKAPPDGMIVQGNVGIGTPTPANTLDINGTERVTNTGTSPAIKILQQGNVGTTPGTGGAFVIDTTSSTGNGMQIYTNRSNGTQLTGLLSLYSQTTSYDEPMLYVYSNSTATTGANTDIRLDSPNPDIVFVETTQTAPAGKFQFAVKSDLLQFNSRNAANTAFQLHLGMTHPGALAFYSQDDNRNYVSFIASASLSSTTNWVLPRVDGTAGQAWLTDGAGNLSFGNPLASITSGSTSYIQNSNTLQSGSTFYTSSGTAVQFTATTATVTNLSLQGTTPSLKLYNGSFYSGLDVGSLSASTMFTLPTADGSNGQFIKTDGSGNWSFGTPAGGGDALLAANQSFTGSNLFQRSNPFYAIKVLQTGQTIDSPTDGAIAIDNTGNAQHALAIYSSQGSQTDPLVNIYASNPAMTQPVLNLMTGATSYPAIYSQGIQNSGITIITSTTPPVFSTDRNDWNVGAYSVVRASASTGVNVSGLANGQDGRSIVILNVGTTTLVMVNESANSQAQNRLLCSQEGRSANPNVAKNGSITFYYDGTSQRWRCE